MRFHRDVQILTTAFWKARRARVCFTPFAKTAWMYSRVRRQMSMDGISMLLPQKIAKHHLLAIVSSMRG